MFDERHAAVREVDLEIRHGELVVLVGPSGSGKSTLLRLIAGLEAPSSGRILIDGSDVTSVPPQRRDLAMVFQSYALYPHKSVRENLGFSLRMKGRPAAEIDARVKEIAGALQIDTLLDRRPAQLSGGQRQRVALGRAMVRDPKAFLFDEPLSNLDPGLRLETRTELALLHRRLGATMVYVTHDQEEAMKLGDRVVLLRDGRIEQAGPPMEIYLRPASLFAARFLGSPPMNILPVELDLTDGRPVALTDGGRLTLTGFSPASLASSSSGSRSILLGIRPEDVALDEPDGAPLTATVQAVELLGAETIVALDLKTVGGDLLVRAGRDANVKVGERTGLRPAFDELHVFDAETGTAIPRTAAA